jgi:hypothetical protein
MRSVSIERRASLAHTPAYSFEFLFAVFSCIHNMSGLCTAQSRNRKMIGCSTFQRKRGKNSTEIRPHNNSIYVYRQHAGHGSYFII